MLLQKMQYKQYSIVFFKIGIELLLQTYPKFDKRICKR